MNSTQRSLTSLRKQVRSNPALMQARMTKYIPHKPTPKQWAFLLLPHREAFFGGQPGGGKSDALLMGALQYADVPGYSALLLRRTYADLALPGALMDRSLEWLVGTDARWNSTTKTWTFPSGATVTFGYLENEKDKFRYQGAEFQYVGFDELTQFSETQYTYLFSRLRRLAGVNIPLRMRSAGNPPMTAEGQWVKPASWWSVTRLARSSPAGWTTTRTSTSLRTSRR
ncbi:MAG: terminase family protein [Caldilinea sp.]|nr:terminase family protein [Caldilinea sp.]